MTTIRERVPASRSIAWLLPAALLGSLLSTGTPAGAAAQQDAGVATEHDTDAPSAPGQARVVRQEWYGVVVGARIEGEHWMVLQLPDGSERRSGPRPWSARRAPSR